MATVVIVVVADYWGRIEGPEMTDKEEGGGLVKGCHVADLSTGGTPAK